VRKKSHGEAGHEPRRLFQEFVSWSECRGGVDGMIRVAHFQFVQLPLRYSPQAAGLTRSVSKKGYAGHGRARVRLRRAADWIIWGPDSVGVGIDHRRFAATALLPL